MKKYHGTLGQIEDLLCTSSTTYHLTDKIAEILNNAENDIENKLDPESGLTVWELREAWSETSNDLEGVAEELGYARERVQTLEQDNDKLLARIEELENDNSMLQEKVDSFDEYAISKMHTNLEDIKEKIYDMVRSANEIELDIEDLSNEVEEIVNGFS